jgi:hypothetical protein
MAYSKYITAQVNPTITLDAYTAGDVVGGLLTFDLSQLTTNGGLLNNLVLIDEDSQAEAYKLYLFDALPSTITNDAAFAPTIADLTKLRTVITIATADYVTVNSMDYVLKEDINVIFSTAVGALYGYLVATDTPDYANTDALWLALGVIGE